MVLGRYTVPMSNEHVFLMKLIMHEVEFKVLGITFLFLLKLILTIQGNTSNNAQKR